MKISSKLELCNLALVRIKQRSISSFEDDKSPQAECCRLVYEQCKSTLLSQYNWTFAISRKILNKLEAPLRQDDTNLGYNFVYALPEGFLRLIGLYNNFNNQLVAQSGCQEPYILEGSYILSNVDNLRIKFVRDIDNVSIFSPLFIECLSLDIAIKLCQTFTDSTTYLQVLQSAFEMAIEKAKIVDCQQIILPQVQSYPLLMDSMLF